MCGIAGIVGPTTSGQCSPVFAQLSRDLLHRGPDGVGFAGWTPGGPACIGTRPSVVDGYAVGLMHRRLSIIDLSTAGAQPMRTPDGRFIIVYNGEIYNYLELRRELEDAGVSFVSHSDTEVLLAAWAQWGPASLHRLEGMFAFAVLDTARATITLARDPFGIKPLFYAQDSHRLVFASELPALLRIVPGRRHANAKRVFEFLRFGATDHAEDTLIDGVYQLPPAHMAELDIRKPARLAPIPYWLPPAASPCDVSFDEASRLVRGAFLRNIERHLRSDVPVGACLSGGIDSSAIVTAMRQVSGDRLDLHAFSYFADDESLSEERWARTAADAASATLHGTQPSLHTLPADLDRMIAVQGEPFGSTSVYAQYRVFQLVASKGIKVVLDGQGADELFGGYYGHVGARIASLVRRRAYREAVALWRAASRRPGLGGVHLLAASYLLPERIQEPFRRIQSRELAPPWLAADWLRSRSVTFRRPDMPSGDDVLASVLRAGVTGGVRTLLRYEDRNSMSFSIESRVPFLTTSFVELVLSLPESHVVSTEGETKSVFRAAMRGIVPDAILDRTDKIGFQTPEHRWITSLAPWVERLLFSKAARRIPIFRHEALAREWNAVRMNPARYRTAVWRWINLIRWSERLDINYS